MKVSVIGAAGVLGSCISFNIVTHKLADELVMIDLFQDPLTGHQLDLKQVASAYDINVIKGDYPDIAGSDIVIIAAGAPTGAIKQRSDLLPAACRSLKMSPIKLINIVPKPLSSLRPTRWIL